MAKKVKKNKFTINSPGSKKNKRTRREVKNPFGSKNRDACRVYNHISLGT